MDNIITENTISIKPSITEAERFVQFLNDKFKLGIQNDLLILIHETRSNTLGFFMPKEHIKSFKSISQELVFKQQQNENEFKPINSITLSSHTLRQQPYEVIAHELAHYLNHKKGVSDTTRNQYHNKKFKQEAERLLLEVERDKRKGYAYTKETEAFKFMLQNEFKPDLEAFKIFQSVGIEIEKPKSRLLKFSCECGSIIRTAKNEDKPLKAICQYCNSEFKECE